MKEVEAAFCLCGARRCRARLSAFVGEQSNNQVLTRCHRLVERHAALSRERRAADFTKYFTKESRVVPDGDRGAGVLKLLPGRGLLRDVPDGSDALRGSLALFMFLRAENGFRATSWTSTARRPRRSTAKAAGRGSLRRSGWATPRSKRWSVRENRAQSMAICLSKVRYLLGRGADEGDEGRLGARRERRRRFAPRPRRIRKRGQNFRHAPRLADRVLLQCMAPHGSATAPPPPRTPRSPRR